MKNKKLKKSLPRDMAYVAVGAVLIAICSWIAFPGPVPFTLQTFGVMFVLGLLKGRRGTFAVLVYLLMGAVGLPVFSGFSGGVGVLAGATGGYILGFFLGACVYWLVTAVFGEGLAVRAVASAGALGVCYAFGTVWYVFVFAGEGAGSLASALGLCVAPFILPDILKTAGAFVLSRGVEKRIMKRY